MSEVKRWYIGVYGGEAQARVCAPHPHEFIRDSEGEIFVIAEQFDACEARNRALQQGLTAADERADALEAEVARLNRVKLALKELVESHAGNLSVYRYHLSETQAMAEKVRGASLGMQKKCLADLIDYLHQNGAALKPAESAKKSGCTWAQDASGLWSSTCGVTWAFMDGSPHSHGMHFCHSCGKTLVVESAEPV